MSSAQAPVRIAFMGAGSTIFAKSILGDCMYEPSLQGGEFALYDIDPDRLRESALMLRTLNHNVNQDRATITTHLGPDQRRNALRGARYVVNAIQVGGYDPGTIIDFEIPKKYGLRQTIADTLGIGGIFRVLRTAPVMLDFACDIAEVCPDAWLLNYTNPMAALCMVMQQHTPVKTVGLCHSVQVCTRHLLEQLDLAESVRRVQWKIAGINHMAWLLEITDNGKDLYPEIKRRAFARQDAALTDPAAPKRNMVRIEIMRRFGYYVTESSEHMSEYVPYFIKSQYPELIEKFRVPLDEYIRRCIGQIEEWKKQRDAIVANPDLTHKRTNEYGSRIMAAMETDEPFRFHGNVLNTGLITNLPRKACVEVACIADRNGVTPTYVGDLPEQLAALNRTNINTQILTVEAAITRKRDKIYQAAMLDPHTGAELPLDKIVALCDDLIEAHGQWLPKFD